MAMRATSLEERVTILTLANAGHSDRLSQCRWFRKGSNIGAVSLGAKVCVLGHEWARKDVEITSDPMD